MNVNSGSVLAATAVVGYNLITGKEQEKVGYNRFMVGVSYVGSAAVGDTAVEVKVGGKVVHTIYNGSITLAIVPAQIQPVRIFVPANRQVEGVVSDAAATNPVMLDIQFIP